MSTREIRVGVNGYGVIGKRIADAVAAQDDMELVGVADVVADWRIRVAVEKGYAVFSSAGEAIDKMRAARIPLKGILDDLLGQVDVIADATPKKIAAANFERYQAAQFAPLALAGIRRNLSGLITMSIACTRPFEISNIVTLKGLRPM